MIDPTLYKPFLLKLKKNDKLELLSALTQDSLCNVTSMHFYAEKEVFSLRLNRFCWELLDNEDELDSYYRVHCTMSFHGVKQVQKRNFSQYGQVRSLNLLSVIYPDQDGSDQNRVRLLFSGDMDLEIVLDESGYIQANDFGHPWPTHNKPIHLHEHFEEISLKNAL